MERRGGYTLPELVFVVAIVAATLGFGLSNFRGLALDTARTREVNSFVHAIYLARGEAIKRNGVVSLCPSGDGDLCAPPGSTLAFGLDRVRQPGSRSAGRTRSR